MAADQVPLLAQSARWRTAVASRKHKDERGIWQRRYWEQLVRNEAHFNNCLDYIHYNPIKHGYVKRAGEWPHSSFSHWVKKGSYPMDWVIAPAAGDTERNEMLG